MTRATHFCLIQGEAGIGKTRLAEGLLHWAATQGATAVRTRTYVAAGELAYAPIIDWLRSPPLQGTVVTLDAVWRSRIALLLPELASASPPDGTKSPPTTKNYFEEAIAIAQARQAKAFVAGL